MFFRPGAGVARSWRECCPAPPGPAAGGRERSVRYRHTVRHHRAEAKPGPPHVVRIGTDIFLRRGKCPRRRVRCGGTGRRMSALPPPAEGKRSGARDVFSARRGDGASLSAAARCDPDTLPWRPKCSSQAHYAAAAPRPAQPAGKGGPGKTGGPRPWRGCCPVPPGPAAGGRHPSFASERTFSVVVENVRDAACEGGRPPGGRKRCGRYRHIVRGPVTRRRLHFLTRSVQYHTVRYFFQERER